MSASNGEYSFEELMKCAERELALRRSVYAKRGWTVSRAKEIGMMKAIAKHFRELIEIRNGET